MPSLSAWYMTLNGDRNQVFDNIGWMFPFRLGFIYRRVPMKAPALQIFELLRWKPYLCIAGLVLFWSLQKFLLSICLPDDYSKKIRIRSAVVIGIFIIIFWRYFSSTIVLLFNTPEPPESPITGTESLLQALESGSYIAIVEADTVGIGFIQPSEDLESPVYNRLKKGTQNPKKVFGMEA